MQALLIISLLGIAWGNAGRNPMENPDLFQGDIVGVDRDFDRNGTPYKSRLWPRGVIPYTIDRGLLPLRSKIERAMDHISSQTCIKFKERSDESSYIKIFSGVGCYSYWGRSGGQQPVSLGRGCEPLGTIIHELNHAIGFHHEQNRSDRDDYLIIYWENIRRDGINQFDKLLPSREWITNKFDYDSIMLYGETNFSKDGYSKTMVAKTRGITLVDPPAKGKLSASDIERINVMYGC